MRPKGTKTLFEGCFLPPNSPSPDEPPQRQCTDQAGTYCPSHHALTFRPPNENDAAKVQDFEIMDQPTCRPGHYGTSTGAVRYTNGTCEGSCNVPGYFCPAGSTSPENPEHRCQAGHYCPAGSASSIEYQCGRGHYCEKSASQPTPCPAGRFVLITLHFCARALSTHDTFLV